MSIRNREGSFGATAIDLERRAPQTDIFRGYKEGLRRPQAENIVALEVERRITRGQPPLRRDLQEAARLLANKMGLCYPDFPIRSSVRCNCRLKVEFVVSEPDL